MHPLNKLVVIGTGLIGLAAARKKRRLAAAKDA
mgnify:CR=1 FL=1